MPNKFSGQVKDTNGKILKGVNVNLTGPNIPPTNTITDNNGMWEINLNQDINEKDK